MTGADRGQAYTLEGLIAAIVLASAVLYGLQAVDVAPYTDDTRNDRQLETLRTQASDALSVAEDDGSLRRAVTCINGTTGEPHALIGQRPNAVTGGNVAGLGGIFNGSLNREERQYIVLFDYHNSSGGSARIESRIIHPNVTSPEVAFTREPVTVTRHVAIYNSTRIQVPVSGAGCLPTDTTFAERWDNSSVDLWLPRETTGVADSELFAVVRVRVIAW